MLVKRNENGNIVEALYNSSHILASSYDKGTQLLTVTFARGASYTYTGVRLTDYTRFELAESQGKVLNSHIKPNYTYKQNADVDTTELARQIHEFEKKEMSRDEKNLITTMKAFLAAHEGKDSIDLAELSNVQHFMDRVKNVE